MVLEYWLLSDNDVDRANPTLLDSLPTLYYTMRYLCMGGMDT
jgi:hypothetical protein